jgi:NAD(P)-dependent dehydrogenase (short-subunit alcohol dehydrogenase family)
VQLEDKVTIVTGASSGVGRSIALAFARAGAAVTVDYVGDRDTAEEVVVRIEDAGGRALAVRADVTVQEE